MAKKIILIVLGLIALVAGLAIAAFGTVALAYGGRAGVVQSGYHAISTPTDAFVTNPSDVRNSNGVGQTSNAISVRVDGRNSSKPLFIGVAKKADVDRFLNGASYENVTDVNFGDNFSLETTSISGTTQPAAPGDQSIWVAQASGMTPHLNWPVRSGDYAVVVMNADASPGVSLDARAGLHVKGLFGIGLGATIFGGLVALMGIGLIVWGIAAKRKREEAVAYPGGYPGGGYPGGGYPASTAGYPAGYPPASGTQAPPTTPPPASGGWQQQPASGGWQTPPGSAPPGSAPAESMPPEPTPPPGQSSPGSTPPSQP